MCLCLCETAIYGILEDSGDNPYDCQPLRCECTRCGVAEGGARRCCREGLRREGLAVLCGECDSPIAADIFAADEAAAANEAEYDMLSPGHYDFDYGDLDHDEGLHDLSLDHDGPDAERNRREHQQDRKGEQ